MTHSFRLSSYLDFYRFHRFISEDSSVYPKMKTDYMQAVNLSKDQTLSLFLKNLKNLMCSLKPGLKSSSDG